MKTAIHSKCAKCGQDIEGDSMMLTSDKKLYHLHCSPYDAPPLPKECTCGMDSSELLPCPFCGGAAMLTGLGYDGPADCYDVYVQCSICDSEGQSRLVDKSAGWDEADSVSEAIAAWNRRTPTHRTAGETHELVAWLLAEGQRAEDFAPRYQAASPFRIVWEERAKKLREAAAALAPPPVEPVQGVTEALRHRLWEALRFAASRSVISSAEEEAILAAFPAALAAAPEGSGGPHHCPICTELFKPADLCSTDIELGTCHAACLEGSPTVDLETGDPVDGPIPTFRYDEGTK